MNSRATSSSGSLARWRRVTRCCPTRAAVAAVVLAVAGLASASPLAAQEQRLMPVYDLATPGVALQVETAVRPLDAAPVAWADLAGAARDTSRPEVVRVAAQYLERVVAEDFDALSALSWLETSSASSVANTGRFVAQVLDGLGAPRSVRFVESWLYGDFQALLLDVAGTEGSRLLTLGFTDRGGSWQRSDDWAEVRPVMELYYYLGMLANDGSLLDRRAEPQRALPLELELPAERFPLVLRFDGVLAGDSSAEGSAEAARDAGFAFAARAGRVARDGQEVEFVDLWAPGSREKVAEYLATGSGRFGGLRLEIGRASGQRPILDLDLGSHRVVYGLGAAPATASRSTSDPADRVTSLVLQESGGALLLSRTLYSNLQTLLTSPLVERSVFALVSQEIEP